MKKNLVLFAAATLILVFTTIAKAEFIDRGNGLVYDSVLNISWLQNANYAGHTMSWTEANQWAGDLVFQGYNDWRLPGLTTPCTGDDCTEGDMGHIYNFDNISSDTPGPFEDVRSYMYWSGTENSEDTTKAWRFHFNTGYQGSSSKTLKRYAWAVRDETPTSPVAPEPVSSLLFVIGSATLAARRRWSKKQEI